MYTILYYLITIFPSINYLNILFNLYHFALSERESKSENPSCFHPVIFPAGRGGARSEQHKKNRGAIRGLILFQIPVALSVFHPGKRCAGLLLFQLSDCLLPDRVLQKEDTRGAERSPEKRYQYSFNYM